ncbi:MAG: serine hydrolase domain-containing protein, partial [Pseudomonadota bacterium]
DLDQPLHELLPFEEIAHDERYEQITARHVLTHRTGFPNWRSETGGEMTIAFDPGTDFRYSGEGIQYLERVVSHVVGEPIEAILLREVQEPMGFVNNTWFAANEELLRVVAHGHSVKRAYDARPPTRPGMAHSMHTEAGALANFMVSILAGRGLSTETYDEAFTLVSRSQPEVSEHDVPWQRGFGLGFSITESPYGIAFGHGGNNGDFHAMFEAYRDHGIGYVVMGNNERAWALNEVLRRFLIAGRGVPSTLDGDAP